MREADFEVISTKIYIGFNLLCTLLCTGVVHTNKFQSAFSALQWVKTDLICKPICQDEVKTVPLCFNGGVSNIQTPTLRNNG